jgi:hypothetical protein
MGYNKHAHKSALDGFVEWDEGDYGSGMSLDLSQVERDREAQEAEKADRKARLQLWEEKFPGMIGVEGSRAWILDDNGNPMEMIPSSWSPETTTKDDLIDLVIGGCE